MQICKKRPCRICRRWFRPDPRLKDRQMTCGKKQCQREWHRKQCAQWNKDNPEYFKSDYLGKKLAAAKDKESGPKTCRAGPSKNHITPGLPVRQIQDLIGREHLVIMLYNNQLLYRRFKEMIRSQVIVNTS